MAGDAPGDLGDARFNTFVLEHVYEFVAGRGVNFASPGMFYPFPDTLFFSDTHIGSVIFYIPFRALGFSKLQAFVAWFFVGYLTTYVAAHYAFAKFGLRPVPAAAAAVFFTFSLPSLAQFGHAQLVYRCGVPLSILYLWRGLRSGSGIDLLRSLVWLFVQTLIGIYLGVFLGFLMASFAPAYLFFQGEKRMLWRLWSDLRRRAASPAIQDLIVGGAFITIVAATTALLDEYVSVSRLYGLHYTIGQISIDLPRIYSYLIMDNLPYWHHWLPLADKVPIRQEHQLFVGLGVLGLFVAGVWRLGHPLDIANGQERAEERVLDRAMLAALGVLFVLTLDIGASFALYSKISFYSLLAAWPGINAIRAVARIIAVLMLPIALFAGRGLSLLLYEARPKALSRVLAVGLASLAAFEIASFDKSVFSVGEAERRVSQIVQQAKAGGKGIDRPILALVSPLAADDRPVVTQLDAMLAAQQLGWPTVNGYTSNPLPGTAEKPNCDMAETQYLAFDAWSKARNFHLQESSGSLLRRTVFVNGSACNEIGAKPGEN